MIRGVYWVIHSAMQRDVEGKIKGDGMGHQGNIKEIHGIKGYKVKTKEKPGGDKGDIHRH